MTYFSDAELRGSFAGFGCGPRCRCGPCSTGKVGIGEWYEKEEDDQPSTTPVTAPLPQVPVLPRSVVAPPLPSPISNNSGRRPVTGLGHYGYSRLGYYSQAPPRARLVYPQVSAQLPASGAGYYTYYASDSRGRPDNPPGYHRYAIPEVIQAMQSIAGEWNRLHRQGPRLGIGDLSLMGGGPTPRHGAHQRGLEVDIRPLRSDARDLPATFNDRNYSRSLTQELVDLIRRNSILQVRVILFNDSAIRGVTRFAGHDNHLHVGFHPPSPSSTPAQTGRAIPPGGNIRQSSAVPSTPSRSAPTVGSRLDPLNRLADVHPELSKRIHLTAGVLANRGIGVTITRTGGRRTFAEQDALYAQGRTAPGRVVTQARGGLSNHNYGLAVDLVPLVNGQPTWQVANSVWQAIGDEGKRAGLSWGGDWRTFQDKPHLELPVGLSVQDCLRIHNQGGLPAVWAEASRRLQRR